MTLLTFRAGASALRHIQRDGLRPEHIHTVFGASGAAKWLTIYGLDKAIFSHWLAAGEQPVTLFGTSVGAFKLAAACHTDAAAGLDALAHAYIHQRYPKGVTPDEIEREFAKILQVVMGDDKIDQILSHPKLRFGCGAVRCHGSLASDNTRRQALACSRAAARNLRGRDALQRKLDRIVFHDPRSHFPIQAHDGYRTESIALNRDNITPALKASGSIPVYMHGVKDIAGAGAGVYRDGGLLDYHPVPGNFWGQPNGTPSMDASARDEGLILYPHFYPHCKVGWFDKFLPWRKADPALLDQALLIYPTPAFYALTELGRNPDRKDFATFAKDDAERVRLWTQVAEASHRLGEEFLELADKDQLAAQVQPLTR